EAGFLHVAIISRGCKLDPKLIIAFVKRWRLEMHTLHLPCGECIITLEDMKLQLGLLVDGLIFIESIQFVDWETRRERYAWAYILQIIKGILMPDKSQNLVHLRWLLKLVDFKGVGELSWGSTVLGHCTERCVGRQN
ncbi:hypothetical protein Goklo_016210, partial [Gossypium klotzschianum]|nr:hypothetical protein [Gossypium klotzschianum]